MELILSIALGVGLSAACGFRIFVPLLVMSAAAQAGYLDLSAGFQWMAGYPALITFAVATLLEILAFYIPWVDNALDTIATPTAVVAGAVVTAAVVTDVDPWLKWTLAVIAGGGTAGLVQTSTAMLRGVSSMATAGLGNFVVATAELIGSIMTSLIALLFPLLALAFVVLLLIFFLGRRGRRAQPAPGAASNA
jgi:hypothetical protein